MIQLGIFDGLVSGERSRGDAETVGGACQWPRVADGSDGLIRGEYGMVLHQWSGVRFDKPGAGRCLGWALSVERRRGRHMVSVRLVGGASVLVDAERLSTCDALPPWDPQDPPRWIEWSVETDRGWHRRRERVGGLS